MGQQELDKAAVVALLNRILEDELAGVVRYTHYSLMVFGYGRIPISPGSESRRRPDSRMRMLPVSW